VPASSTRVADAWPEFLKLWERVRSESEQPGTVVVVEGERDRTALRRLGVRGPIALVHRGQRMGALAQALASEWRRVVVLTDWDGEGGQIAHRLVTFLESGALEFDVDLRRRLALILKGEVRHVEGLYSWARRTAESAGAPLDHFLE
jgi:5S rRNA maturation endonuclease (ribonuclease M5)